MSRWPSVEERRPLIQMLLREHKQRLVERQIEQSKLLNLTDRDILDELEEILVGNEQALALVHELRGRYHNRMQSRRK